MRIKSNIYKLTICVGASTTSRLKISIVVNSHAKIPELNPKELTAKINEPKRTIKPIILDCILLFCNQYSNCVFLYK
ncbi:MAG: hypothetical protein ACK5H1_10410 [Tenacibaculum sp.]